MYDAFFSVFEGWFILLMWRDSVFVVVAGWRLSTRRPVLLSPLRWPTSTSSMKSTTSRAETSMGGCSSTETRLSSHLKSRCKFFLFHLQFDECKEKWLTVVRCIQIAGGENAKEEPARWRRGSHPSTDTHQVTSQPSITSSCLLIQRTGRKKRVFTFRNKVIHVYSIYVYSQKRPWSLSDH